MTISSDHISISDFLEEQYLKYNNPSFIVDDPVSIPHRFTNRQDIEISGLLTAIISWGKRSMILKSAGDLMSRLGGSPYDFIMSAEFDELATASAGFVYRTFNQDDCYHTLVALKKIYIQYTSLDELFAELNHNDTEIASVISSFSSLVCSFGSPPRLKKHFADPLAGSAAKRLCMYLRWMVRRDAMGVDFGIWNSMKPSQLMCPLDVHSGRVARSLGLLKRNQNDWQAVIELTEALKQFDAADPVKYDFALFGTGIYEEHWK